MQHLVPWRSLNGSHKRTAKCKKGAERKGWRLAEEEEMAVTSRAFRDYGRTHEMVPSFEYLRIVLSAADVDWTEVIINLTKARLVWRRMTKILIREEDRLQVSRFFLKAVVQSLLLFGTETWMVTPYIGQVLGGYQDQAAQCDWASPAV